VRSATREDAAAVAGVHVRSWQVAYRGLLPDEFLDGLRSEDRVVRYDFDASGPDRLSTIVAIEEGVIVGFATTGPSRDADVPEAGEVYAIYAEPTAWGRGVGRRLMAEARAELDRRGFTAAILWVLAGNDRAQHFYDIDGWQPDGVERVEEIWGLSVGEVRYRRQLP